MKSIIAAGLLLGCAHGAVQAGPYANVEANSGWLADDYQRMLSQGHAGYEGELGEAPVLTSKWVVLLSLPRRWRCGD